MSLLILSRPILSILSRNPYPYSLTLLHSKNIFSIPFLLPFPFSAQLFHPSHDHSLPFPLFSLSSSHLSSFISQHFILLVPPPSLSLYRYPPSFTHILLPAVSSFLAISPNLHLIFLSLHVKSSTILSFLPLNIFFFPIIFHFCSLLPNLTSNISPLPLSVPSQFFLFFLSLHSLLSILRFFPPPLFSSLL